MKHLYLRTVFELLSPLAIGSGRAENTDCDIAINGCGQPFIPATTLAGIYRSFLSNEEQQKYFGYIEGEKTLQSLVRVYDAVLLDHQTPQILLRDNVRLDEWKTAQRGAKFNYEALDTGTKLTGLIELDKNAWSVELEDKLIKILSALHLGELTLGAKGTRGYGRVHVEVQRIAFEFPSQIEKWLDFSPFDETTWKNVATIDLSKLKSSRDEIIMKLELELQSGISIREYFTNSSPDEKNSPDYIHIRVNTKDEELGDALPIGKPVIPGTSWAGAFRHHFAKLGDKNIHTCDSLFGYVNTKQKERAFKSRIRFTESVLAGGTWKKMTRNAVDRFSGGTKDGALYTEWRYFGGKCELEIRLRKPLTDEKRYLAASLMDLHFGLLAVGGLTSVGCGIFKITSLLVNGKNKTACLESYDMEDMYNDI